MFIDLKCNTFEIQVSDYLDGKFSFPVLCFWFSVRKPFLTKHALLVWMGCESIFWIHIDVDGSDAYYYPLRSQCLCRAILVWRDKELVADGIGSILWRVFQMWCVRQCKQCSLTPIRNYNIFKDHFHYSTKLYRTEGAIISNSQRLNRMLLIRVTTRKQ